MKFIVTSTIAAPVAQVWDVVADFGRLAEWSPTVADSRVVDGSEPRVGLERTLRRAGSQRVVRERIAAYEPDCHLAHEVVEGARFPLKKLRLDWTLQRLGEGTLVSVAVDFKIYLPYGPVGLPVWLVARRKLRKEITAALHALESQFANHPPAGQAIVVA